MANIAETREDLAASVARGLTRATRGLSPKSCAAVNVTTAAAAAQKRRVRARTRAGVLVVVSKTLPLALTLADISCESCAAFLPAATTTIRWMVMRAPRFNAAAAARDRLYAVNRVV